MISAQIKIAGLNEVRRGIEAAIAAMSEDAQRKNFTTILGFILKEVKDHTPGSGELRKGWRVETKISKQVDGFNFRGRVFNTKAGKKLTYRSAISGQERPKLKADDTQQTYADVIPILDRGSKPHSIKPRRYPVLIFRSSKSPGPGDPDRSNVVFAKQVSHPGTKAYGTLSIPFKKLQNIIDASSTGIGENVIVAWRRA